MADAPETSPQAMQEIVEAVQVVLDEYRVQQAALDQEQQNILKDFAKALADRRSTTPPASQPL